MKAKNPRIKVRPPLSHPKPAKREKTRSQVQASTFIVTPTLEVVQIPPKPQEEVRIDLQDMEFPKPIPP